MKHPHACSSLLAGALVVLGLADLSAAAQSQATNVPRRANDGLPDRIVLPVGLGTLVDDAGVPYFEARRDCQHVLSLTAQMAVRGSVGGAPARATLWAGTTAIDTVRLEPVSPMSRPDFVLVAKEGNATVRLQGPDRFTRGTAHDSIEAVTGLPLSGAELQGVLTGCPRISGNLQAWAFGRGQIRLIVGERDELHLRRIPLPNTWQLVAWIHTVPGRELRWRAEFYERLARNGAEARPFDQPRVEWRDGSRVRRHALPQPAPDQPAPRSRDVRHT